MKETLKIFYGPEIIEEFSGTTIYVCRFGRLHCQGSGKCGYIRVYDEKNGMVSNNGVTIHHTDTALTIPKKISPEYALKTMLINLHNEAVELHGSDIVGSIADMAAETIGITVDEASYLLEKLQMI